MKKIKFTGINLNSLFFDIASMMSATTIASVFRMFIIIIILRFFSTEEYGIWATITSTVAVIATGGDLGIVNSLRNKLSELYANDSNSLDEAKSYFYTAFVLFLIFAIILSLTLIILFYNIPFESLFKTDNQFIKTQGKSILLWVQFIILLGVPISIGGASFFSFNEARYSALFTTIQSFATFSFVLLASLLNSSIVFVSIGYFLVITLVNITSFIYFIYRRKWFNISMDIFNIDSFINRSKYLFSHGIKFFGLQFSKGFLENSATVIASSTLGLGVAAEFNLVQKLYTFGMGIYQSMFNPLWGSFAENAAKNNWIWCKRTYFLTIKITLVLIPLMIIVFYFYGNYFLFLMSDIDYKVNENLFLILGLSTLFYMLYSTSQTFQCAISKINFTTSILIFFSITIIPITKPFISSYGVNGLALSLSFVWLISLILGNIQTFYFLNNKIKLHRD